MASNVKKYILTAIILGSISAVAAGAIALTNLVTKDKIAENEVISFNKGLSEIFGDGANATEENIDLSSYPLTKKCYTVRINDEIVGYAFKSEGSNDYGKIGIVSGFDVNSLSFISLYLIKNEQSFGPTLLKKYVNPLKEDPTKLEDVSCGATRGAEVVRNMIKEAGNAAIDNFGKK